MTNKLDKILDSVESRNLFKKKEVLQSNHSPEEIMYRDKQVEQVASILAPALLGQKTSNLFIYGLTGTGKTLVAQYVGKELSKRAKTEHPLKIEYINCKLKKVADTEYRLLAELIERFGGEVPPTGLPTDQVYSKFIKLLENSNNKLFILLLDEIDQLVKKISDQFLYNLTRLNSQLPKTQIILVGISNDVRFLDSLDPRVKSSLGQEEIVFPPYDAIQLRGILNKRAADAFNEGAVDPYAIAKCAAFAAREHGDARRALDLLRVAGEIAERVGDKRIIEKHIDEANSKIERDKILDIVETQPKQFQLVLQAILYLEEGKKGNPAKQKDLFNGEEKKIFTGDVYNVYQDLCRSVDLEILTQRRVGDIIGEFDMLGLINATVISKGRYGRTKEIKLSIPNNILDKTKEILRNSLGI
jgi:cell division control protein 6